MRDSIFEKLYEKFEDDGACLFALDTTVIEQPDKDAEDKEDYILNYLDSCTFDGTVEESETEDFDPVLRTMALNMVIKTVIDIPQLVAALGPDALRVVYCLLKLGVRMKEGANRYELDKSFNRNYKKP